MIEIINVESNQNVYIIREINQYYLYRKVCDFEDYIIFSSLNCGNIKRVKKSEIDNVSVSMEELDKIMNDCNEKAGYKTSYKSGEYLLYKTTNWWTPQYEVVQYVGYDNYNDNVIVMKKDKKLLTTTLDYLLTLQEFKNNCNKEINDIIKQIDNINEEVKKANDYEFLPRLDFIEKIKNLEDEKKTLMYYVERGCDYNDQIHCIDKGIKRLSKRLYKFKTKYPNVDLNKLYDTLKSSDYKTTSLKKELESKKKTLINVEREYKEILKQ
jgi:hypothetical protein